MKPILADRKASVSGPVRRQRVVEGRRRSLKAGAAERPTGAPQRPFFPEEGQQRRPTFTRISPEMRAGVPERRHLLLYL